MSSINTEYYAGLKFIFENKTSEWQEIEVASAEMIPSATGIKILSPGEIMGVAKPAAKQAAEKWYLFPDKPTSKLLFGSRVWVTSKQAAKYLGATEWAIRHLMRQPGFPVRNVGIGNAKPFFQVNRFAAKDWLEKNTKVPLTKASYLPTAEELLKGARK